jgi:hypothetical protein
MAETPSPGAGALLDDLLLYRLSRLLAVGGSPVIRLCEGRFGITRREWRLLATSLVEKELVSRSQPAGDRRHVLLRLSKAGESIHAELFPLVQRINAELMAALSPAEAEQFDHSLARLQATAERLLSTACADLPKADRRHGGTKNATPAA